MTDLLIGKVMSSSESGTGVRLTFAGLGHQHGVGVAEAADSFQIDARFDCEDHASADFTMDTFRQEGTLMLGHTRCPYLPIASCLDIS